MCTYNIRQLAATTADWIGPENTVITSEEEISHKTTLCFLLGTTPRRGQPPPPGGERGFLSTRINEQESIYRFLFGEICGLYRRGRIVQGKIIPHSTSNRTSFKSVINCFYERQLNSFNSLFCIEIRPFILFLNWKLNEPNRNFLN